VFNEDDIRNNAAAKFRVGLMFYLWSSIIYVVAGMIILYNGDVRFDGTPSDALLKGVAAVLFAAISTLMFFKGKNYLRNELPTEKLDDIAAASLFYTVMGIPFALGLGAAFFFIIYRMVREPEPHGNICPYCGGYIVINPTNGEASCSGCGKRF